MLRIRNEYKGIKVGARLGNLTAVGPLFQVGYVWKVLMQCDCGKYKVQDALNVLATGPGRVLSCGCLHSKKLIARNSKHGKARTRLHVVWCGMKSRCGNVAHKEFSRYGGRGICVCDEWANDYTAFESWAIASGYQQGLTIDRINNDGNYEPSNCQWLTRSENSRKQFTDKRR